MGLFDRLKSVLAAKTSNIVDLQRALNEARQLLDDAQKDRTWLEGQRRELLLATEPERAKHKVDLADAAERAADLRLYAEELAKRLADTEASEDESRRQAVYDAAKVQADAAVLALSKTYPKLAAGMVAMLKDLAQAQQAVVVANARLPDGAAPLEDPEMAARGVPGRGREVVSDEWVELWGRLDLLEPLEERFQSEIYDCGNGWGRRRGYEGGSASMGEPQASYRRRRFRKIVSRETTNGDWPLPLAVALQIPAVRGSGMLWGDAYPVFNPGLAMAVMGQADPDTVLARLAEADAVTTARPAKVERQLRVEWAQYSEVTPLPEQQSAFYGSKRGQPSGTGSRLAVQPRAAQATARGGKR